MTLSELLLDLKKCQLVVSVQPTYQGGLSQDALVSNLAMASLEQGVAILRLEGLESINALHTEAVIIGLIKKQYPNSEVYITPTMAEMDLLCASPCPIIAMDATKRARPDGSDLKDLIARVHACKKLILADCDTLDSGQYAVQAGADLLATTLCGSTEASATASMPNIDLVWKLAQLGKPIFAEGGYFHKSQIQMAIKAGAAAVVVGTAINDAARQTRWLMPPPTLDLADPNPRIGAVDIGGTWLRFATFTSDLQMLEEVKTPNPKNKVQCLAWIRDQVVKSGCKKVGVSTGGIVDPATGEVWKAKEYLMPDHVGIQFNKETLGVPCVAWGDGHAAAWAHACLPHLVGKRIASIALGTGVGFGFVVEDRIWSGKRGEYPRLNDQATHQGESFESLLAGLHLTYSPTPSQMQRAEIALKEAQQLVEDLFFPDVIVVSGGVGASDWMQDTALRLGLSRSPLGGNAGLYGAASLAMYPPCLP